MTPSGPDPQGPLQARVQLLLAPARDSRGPGGQRQLDPLQAQAAEAPQGPLDDELVLFRGEGAGAVDEQTARPQGPDRGVQQPPLPAAHLPDLPLAPARQRPGVRCREAALPGAGGVEEDAVEMLRPHPPDAGPVPEIGVGVLHSQLLEGAPQAEEPPPRRLHRGDAAAVSHESGDVGGLAAGSRGEVEHLFPRLRIEHQGWDHARGVLNEQPALGVGPRLGQGAPLLSADREGAVDPGHGTQREPRGLQLRPQRGGVRFEAVAAERRGPLLLEGRPVDLDPGMRPDSGQALDEGRRQRGPGFGQTLHVSMPPPPDGPAPVSRSTPGAARDARVPGCSDIRFGWSVCCGAGVLSRSSSPALRAM